MENDQKIIDYQLKLAACFVGETYGALMELGMKIITTWGYTEIPLPFSYRAMIGLHDKCMERMGDFKLLTSIAAEKPLSEEERALIMELMLDTTSLQMAIYATLEEQLGGVMEVECPHCHKWVHSDVFCEACGKKLTEQEGEEDGRH